ncbi:hypothetical protein [Rhodococcus sp. NPDC059234]|uniref:hypothetical protein n=1 Tax=Rhodococcus sp. NPDC059234 TaxID=3346781 RepID=UPI003670DF40
MRHLDFRRSSRFVRIAVSAGVLALPFGSAAVAAASPPAPATTAFQVPVAFTSGCFSVLMCNFPLPVSLVPTASTGSVPGVVTFGAVLPQLLSGLDCLDVTVHWLNLATGASGTALVRAHTELGQGRPIPPEEWCAYPPVAVTTGGGTIAATADVGASAHAGWFQVPIGLGFGTFPVP